MAPGSDDTRNSVSTQAAMAEIAGLDSAMRELLASADKGIAAAGTLIVSGLGLALSKKLAVVPILLPYALTAVFFFMLQKYIEREMKAGVKRWLEETIDVAMDRTIYVQSRVAYRFKRPDERVATFIYFIAASGIVVVSLFALNRYTVPDFVKWLKYLWPLHIFGLVLCGWVVWTAQRRMSTAQSDAYREASRYTPEVVQTISKNTAEPFWSVRPLPSVTHFSESSFTVQGHGVHTAVTEVFSAQQMLGYDVELNTMRRRGLLHIHTMGPLSLLRATLHKGPRCVSGHITVKSLEGSICGASVMRSVIRLYMKWFFNHADLVVALSETSAQELREIGVKSQLEVVPNGVELQAFSTRAPARETARSSFGFAENDFIVLCVGQIQPRKGVEAFLECARSLPALRFVWVGSFLFGPMSSERRNLRRLIQSAPANVAFTGQIDRADLPRYYRAADLFFLASKHETFGLTPLEAAASGLPLVLSDLPVFKEVFGHVEDSYARMKGVPDAVRVISEVKANPGALKSLAAKAQLAAQRYSSLDVAATLQRAYENAILSTTRRAMVYRGGRSP